MTKAKESPLAAWKAENDRPTIVKTRVQAALAKMAEESPEKWFYEEQFRKFAALANSDMAYARKLFGAHVVEPSSADGKRTWFATAETASEARKCLKAVLQ